MRIPSSVLPLAAACAAVGAFALLELSPARGIFVVGALWFIMVLVALRYRWRR